MNIKEVDLPGIGRKFQLQTRTGDSVVVVIHDNGLREIYHFGEDEQEECLSNISLEDDEARQMAAIIGGMSYKPKALEEIEMSLEDLVIEWFKIEPDAACVGQTIGELTIRQASGAVIIAVIDKTRHTKVINPGPEHVLTAHCTLVATGEREQLKKLRALLQLKMQQ
ncbi:K(+)/H(+) antiporter subunit khtT [Chlamydia abortus]|nr:K(+)/H(+) antiporter subunit khtT [Chlamydia abortus]